LAADAVRRVLLGQLRQSGRFYVDLGHLVADATPSAAPDGVHVTEGLVRKLVGRAILAPSGGNHQPWRWTARGSRLELREDPAQRMGLTDSDNRGTAVGLGAAAESLVLAAHAEGLELGMVVAEEGGELVAMFDLGVATGAGEPHAFDTLEAYLERRHTDRRLGTQTPLRREQWEELQVAARSVDGVGLHLVSERVEIEELATLIGQGDRLRILDSGLSREMFAELRWTRAEAEASGDGLEVESLALAATDRAGLELCRKPEALALVAEWGLGSGLVRLGQRWASASSALGLLTVAPSDRLAYFRAGRAMQRLWLTAVAQGLGLHPLTFLPYAFAGLRAGGQDFAPATRRELEELRAPYARLLELDGSEGEVLLFRLFPAAGAVPPAVRRPVSAVLRFESR
jgi:nitroreductase